MGFHCGNTATQIIFCEMNIEDHIRTLPEEVTQGTLEGDIVPEILYSSVYKGRYKIIYAALINSSAANKIFGLRICYPRNGKILPPCYWDRKRISHN